MWRSLLALVMALWVGSAAAAEVLSLEVVHRGPVYELELDARVAIPASTVLALITDYQHLPEINPDLSEVEILRQGPPTRVRMLSEVCFWLFCYDITHVEDFEPLPDGLEAVIVPELSEFHSGLVSWHVHAEGEGARVYMHALLEPAFPVPPLIGPLLIRSGLRRMAEKTVTALERRGLQGPRSGTSHSPGNPVRLPGLLSPGAGSDHR